MNFMPDPPGSSRINEQEDPRENVNASINEKEDPREDVNASINEKEDPRGGDD